MEEMVKTQIPRNNFSSGIISQQLSGRIDLPQFQNGVSFLENFNININGSISKRTGFELVGKNNTNTESYFIKFVFNQEQVYLLEFKSAYFVVWLHTEDNKLVLYNNGQQFNHPYTFSDIENLKYSQNYDKIYFCHNKYPPKILTRTYTNNVLNFTFANVVFDSGTETENPVTKDGNPSCCVFYQNRMIYAGFSNAINKIWSSDMGYYNRFTTKRDDRDDILDIDGFNFALTELSLPILWIVATTNGLVLGSVHGIALVSTSSGQLTPFSFACNLVNDDGCSSQQPIIVGTTLIYIDSTLQRLKAFNYAYNTDSYESSNLNIMCPELINDNIKKIVYQQDENDYIYVMTESGDIFYLLYSSLEQFFSWGKIKTYSAIKNIETLEKFTSGTNLFLFDKNNNIIRKSYNFILKKQEDFLTISNNKKHLHERYYNYLLNVINNFNYLDFSQEVYYHKTSTLTYQKDYENEQGEFGTITSSDLNEFVEDINELIKRTIRTRKTTEYGELEEGEFEIREKISNNQIKVRVLSNDITRNVFDDWSYNKNELDGFDEIYNESHGVQSNPRSVCIVGDGYSSDNVVIENHKIKLPQGIYIGHFRIGYNYTAILKTMNLGGMIDMTNTMIMKKNIIKVYCRLYNSWGGKFGTDYFNLKNINFLKLENSRYGENYTLEDQDIKLEISDKWEYNKFYYIIQDSPYPFNVNSITLLEEQN
jgi:hypothetical protein